MTAPTPLADLAQIQHTGCWKIDGRVLQTLEKKGTYDTGFVE
jgi:hypothetical protein